MRKFTLLFMLLLGAVGVKAQVEYVAYQPTAPVTVFWYDGGNQPSYAGSYFRVSKEETKNGNEAKVCQPHDGGCEDWNHETDVVRIVGINTTGDAVDASQASGRGYDFEDDGE